MRKFVFSIAASLMLAVLVAGCGGPASVEPFTVVVIPDTQNYVDHYPEIFVRQTTWIVEQRANRNIVFVTHVGDLVYDPQRTEQWEQADAAMDLLDTADIPYGVTVGNHDWDTSAPPPGTDVFNTYFGVDRFQGRPYYGGYLGETNDHSYQLFSAGGMQFIIVHVFLTKTPDPAALAWAQGLLDANPTRRAIVVTHDLLGNTSFSLPGKALFQALREQKTLFLMLGGHEEPAVRRQDQGPHGNVIYSLRSCYQNYDFYQSGYLRIMTFRPQSDEIVVETYSPTQDKYLTDDANQFTLAYPMRGRASR